MRELTGVPCKVRKAERILPEKPAGLSEHVSSLPHVTEHEVLVTMSVYWNTRHELDHISLSPAGTVLPGSGPFWHVRAILGTLWPIATAQLSSSVVVWPSQVSLFLRSSVLAHSHDLIFTNQTFSDSLQNSEVWGSRTVTIHLWRMRSMSYQYWARFSSRQP